MEEKAALIESNIAKAQLPSAELMEPVKDFDESTDIRDYIAVVLRHKGIILAFLIIVFATTLAVTLRMTPLFMATGRLEINPRPPQVTKFQEVQLAGFYVPTEELIQTQLELLQSYSLAERVVKRLQADGKYEPIPPPERSRESLLQKIEQPLAEWKKSLKSWFRIERETTLTESDRQTSVEESMAGAFLGGLQVSPKRNTTIVSLSYTSHDPAMARDAVNALIKEFMDWQIDRRIEASKAAANQLEKQIEVSRHRLEESESELNRFSKEAGIVSLESKANLVYKQLEEINNALSQAETERLAKESLYRITQKGDFGSLPKVFESPFFQELRTQLIKLEAEQKKLSATFKTEYPNLKTLTAQIDDIRQKITQEERRAVETIKRDYLISLEKENAFRKKSEENKALVMDLNEKAAQYRILEREVEINKQIHQSLVERSKEIDANTGIGAVEIGNIQVVDYAKLPLAPYKPDVRRNLFLAVVVGLMGGIGLAFLLEYLDNTVKRIDELPDRFGIPVLSIIPLEEKAERDQLFHFVRLKPDSGFSESIRTARFSIQLSSSVDHPPKILLITSTTENEGKTTVACNLAQAFASSEEKVLLIDCDLRKPRIHKVFRNPSGSDLKGLSHFLSGNCKLGEAVHPSETTGLFLMFAGPRPPNPVELIASRRMRLTLQFLSMHFDRIIIDSPPFAGFADNLVLGNRADGVVLITSPGHTNRQVLRTTLKSLHNVKGNILGCIINKLDQSYRYSDYNYKYYNYYRDYRSRIHSSEGEETKTILPQRVIREQPPEDEPPNGSKGL